MGSCIQGAVLAVLVAISAPHALAGQGSEKSGSGKGKDMKVVTVLRDGDCGSDAIARVKDVAKRFGIEVTIEEVIVETEQQIQERRFLGSPTVRIKGLDIDPSARGLTSYAMT